MDDLILTELLLTVCGDSKALFTDMHYSGYGLETGTAAELRLALTITLTLTDTGFAVLTLLLGYIEALTVRKKMTTDCTVCLSILTNILRFLH